MAQERYTIGIDTGGTFTDIVVLGKTGELITNKAPTTPWDFSVGVMDALKIVAQDMGLSLSTLLSRTSAIKHGTTVATNALINRDGSRVGLITTAGFEDTIFIMRAIGKVAGLSEDEIKHQATIVKPVPMVSKQLVRGVTELIDFNGNVVIPVSAEEAREAIRSLVEDDEVEAIAVNLLFGYVNPIHENKIKELVEEMYPDRRILVSLASELVPLVREYARSNTVIINAFLDAPVRNYIDNLRAKLAEAGYERPVMLMQANGGMTTEEEIAAVSLLQSGPCGGVTATKFWADILGHQNVAGADVGGTSFDVSLVVDGLWRYAREPVVERFHIAWPMMDVESIGAGGGTIARVDPATKTLRVGPKSAGANPGPVCYGLGNTEPTVTDADLVLGIIDPDYFLGGRMKLDKKRAEAAIKEKIAGPLGMEVVQAAAGIFDITNSHMADLLRKKVIQVGLAPDELIIYAFGGAGAVHAAGYASELGAKRVYVFPSSAVFSAFGIAVADVIYTHMATYRYTMPVDPESLNRTLSGIEERLLGVLQRDGFEEGDIEFRRTFYMRYRRQLNELPVRVPTKRYDVDDIKGITDEFDRRYEETYGAGTAYSEAGIELISLSIDAVGKTSKPEMRSRKEVGPDPSGALKGSRKVYFTFGVNQWLDTKIYELLKLNPGSLLEGPSIIETPTTTIVVPPQKSAKVDVYGNVEIIL